MRIGLIIYGTLDTVSGGYLYDRKMVEHLERQGHQVEIVSMPWRSYRAHLLDNWSNEWVDRLVDAEFDLLIQDELNHPSLFLINRRFKRRSDTPIVSVVHHLRVNEAHPHLLRHVYRWVERAYCRTVDAFVFNSETTKRSVESLIGTTRNVIVYPGGDRFERLDRDRSGLADETIQLLFVGNLIERKGLHTLLSVLIEAPSSIAWSLDVVGDDRVDRTYVDNVIGSWLRSMPNRDRIRFWGKVDDATLEERFCAADLFVVPSQYEGFGIVYLEAMGFGIPVIASDGGAAGEFVTHGENGYLVDPENGTDLERWLIPLMESRALRESMGARAKATFESHPTWEESCRRFETFIKDIGDDSGSI